MLGVKPVQQTFSLAKPQILSLSCSGSLLKGAIIERSSEQRYFESTKASIKAVERIVVVHANSYANFQWEMDSDYRTLLFSKTDAVISLDSLFDTSHWSRSQDLFLLAIDPILINRLAKEIIAK